MSDHTPDTDDKTILVLVWGKMSAASYWRSPGGGGRGRVDHLIIISGVNRSTERSGQASLTTTVETMLSALIGRNPTNHRS